ncbi:MAG: PEGA domain-containing protein [Chloroflexi bacterium]|nr:PEGA domain-containing protein [Chloroflexota bacterium]
MELPFTVVFEPPSRSELRALLRMRGHWAAGVIVALTIGIAYLLANVARADARAATGTVPLQVISAPTGATVWVDGHQQGTTPLDVPVAPGDHTLLLKASEALDSQYSLNVGTGGRTFDAALWRRAPAVTHLRPTLPGATLSDARLLETGNLGLTIGLPPSRQIQAWSLDPATGEVRLLMGTLPGAQLAFAPDGHHLAYLGSDVGPPSPGDSNAWSDSSSDDRALPKLNMLWLFDAPAAIDADESTAAPPSGWRPPLEATEQLVDATWSPRADRLLVVASQPVSGSARRSRAWFVDADGQRAAPAFTLPSDVAPGTAIWSPDATHVAFVAHAGQVNALCLLGIDGSFRYIADLDPSSTPPTYPPLSWSADGQQMVFVAPHQHAPGAAFDWLAPAPQHAVFVANLDQSTATALGDTPLNEAIWRQDGQLLGLWRAGPDAPVGIRLLDESGTRSQDVVQLPLKPGATYTSMWDLSHAELLVASRNPSASNDYWLVRLGAGDDR